MSDIPANQSDERSPAGTENPIGLYRHPDGFEIGVIDPSQGDAVIRQGFTLVEVGRDAAMTAGSSKEAKKAEGSEEVSAPKKETSTGQAADASESAPKPKKESK